ncbi:MAG: hypothetical protein HOP29_01160 [Phycisphaerales bacterium]|nr:hypothetical protein [Phycisphaerales bacterium]
MKFLQFGIARGLVEGSKLEKSEIPCKTWAELVSEAPPGRPVKLQDDVLVADGRDPRLRVNTVEVLLWCDADTCNSWMLFECVSDEEPFAYRQREPWQKFVTYRCKHCERTTKDLAFMFWSDDAGWMGVKLGEWPPYGPHVPNRVLKFVDEDFEFFLQGRRAESLGLGIGAFAYYRRVVENQKNKLFDRIIAAARKVGMKADEIAALEGAKDNFQFTRSMENFKAILPQGLLVNGQNPLQLLHRALSIGIHSSVDNECLGLARDIRIVLTELADRISQILKDSADVNDAVTRLSRKRSTDS